MPSVQCDEGCFQSPGANMVKTASDEIELDEAIFELYKKEKVNMLKRKFNIQCMNDLNDLKKNKVICSDSINGPCSKSQSHVPFSDIVFRSKLQSASGKILSPQAQAAICQCLHKYCIEASCEQREAMILRLLDLVCKHNGPKDDVLINSINVAGCAVDLFSSQKDVIHEILTPSKPQAPSDKCDLELKLRTDTDQDCSHEKGKFTDREVQFTKLNKSSSQKLCFPPNNPVAKSAQVPTACSHRRALGVDYVPDTYSPTPCSDPTKHHKQESNIMPSKQATGHFKCQSAPSKPR